MIESARRKKLANSTSVYSRDFPSVFFDFRPSSRSLRSFFSVVIRGVKLSRSLGEVEWIAWISLYVVTLIGPFCPTAVSSKVFLNLTLIYEAWSLIFYFLTLSRNRFVKSERVLLFWTNLQFARKFQNLTLRGYLWLKNGDFGEVWKFFLFF